MSGQERDSLRTRLGGLGLVLGLSCAPQAEPVAAVPTERTAPSPLRDLDTLVDDLDRTAATLAALPPESTRSLSALLDSLPGAERQRVMADAEVAASRPVLHLLAGGESPAAEVALATTPRGADELVEAARRAGAALGPLVGPVGEMTRRAARAVLADYTARLAARDAPDAVYDIAESAAETLGRRDIAVAVLRVRLERHDEPRIRLRLSHRLGELLRLEDAQRQMDAATAAAGAERLGPEIAEVGRVLALAQSGLTALGAAATDAQRLRGARDLLALGRADDALVVLGRLGRDASPLGRAALRARALVSDSSCPGIPRPAANPALCAAAWADSRAAREASSLVASAWAQGGDREASAVDTYVGFVHVLPFMHAAEIAEDATALVERLRALDEELGMLTAPSARHRGVRLFARALAAGFEARAAGDIGPLDDAVADELAEAALAWTPAELKDPLPQAALLAVAALLVRDRDVGELLSRLSEPAAPLVAARTSLSALTSLAWGERDAALASRDRLADVMLREQTAVERSATILLMAEIDAAVAADERRLDVLRTVGGQLGADPTAGALGVRGVLDRAGAFAAQGNFQDAGRALAPFRDAPVTDSLTWLAHAAALVAQSRSVTSGPVGAASQGRDAPRDRAPEPTSADDAAPSADALQSVADQLTSLSHVEGAPQSGPPAAWVRAWSDALSHDQALSACGASRACKRRVERGRHAVDLVGVAGRSAAQLLVRGTLAISATELLLRYDPPTGITPTVRIRLALVPVPVPPGYDASPSSSSSSARASTSRSR